MRRQPGLAQVWNDVLGFEGCEFYCSEHPGTCWLFF